jgi:Rieske Fe-S protein
MATTTRDRSGGREGADRRRRGFLGWILGGSLGALGMLMGRVLAGFVTPPDQPVDIPEEIQACLADDPVLMNDGFKIVRYGPDPVILVRVGHEDYRAFSATCTHLGCVVDFKNGPNQTIVCNCHGGSFDLTGLNISGPPPRPLMQYRVRISPSGGSAAPGILISRT